MRIHLHISLAGVPSKQRNITLDMPDGATVRQALEQYTEAHDAPFSLGNMRGIIILHGDTHATLNAPLHHGDTLRLLKPVRYG